MKIKRKYQNISKIKYRKKYFYAAMEKIEIYVKKVFDICFLVNIYNVALLSADM